MFYKGTFQEEWRKKRLEETQTLRDGCSKAETKNFAPPPRRPLSRGAGRPKCNQLKMVTTFTYKPSLVRIDARNFKLSTNTPTNTHIPTDRTDYNTLCHSFASVQCITLLLPLASVSAATSQEITPGSAHRSFKNLLDCRCEILLRARCPLCHPTVSKHWRNKRMTEDN